MMRIFNTFMLVILLPIIASCDIMESISVKRKDMPHGELVLLTCNGMQSSIINVYYKDKDGAIFSIGMFDACGDGMHEYDDAILVSILKSINDEVIIFRYKGKPDWSYDLSTKKLIVGTYAKETIELYNSDQLKASGSWISKSESNKYLEIKSSHAN